MNIFDALSSEPEMKFGFRGEDITYRLQDQDKEIYIEFTYLDGPKVYSETIARWKNGSRLTEEEKKKVFSDVVRFVMEQHKKPIVVINTNDPSKDLWKHLCSTNQSVIEGIEYTSRK
jgi:hypothetical protein